MNDLISVGGVCFVAVEPEKGTANLDGRDGQDGLERIGTDPASPEGYAVASGEEADEAEQDHRPKRKYRPRGERTRQEQWRDAARRYRLEHRDKVREYQRKYRERKRLANETLQREP